MKKTSPPQLFAPMRQMAIEARMKTIKADDADFLVREAALTIADRLDATNRDFENAVDIFSPFNCMNKHLKSASKTKNTVSIYSPRVMATNESEPGSIIASSYDVLPLAENSKNLITSVFALHRTNDIPGIFAQIKRALIPDGLFMACLPGDRSLSELRACLLEAESKLTGTASLRIDPFVEVRQAGSLLQRAGFALPVVDSDILTVRYDSVFDIVKDLRAMGATSALSQKVKFGPRKLFETANEIYHEKFGDPDGRIRVTVEIIYLSGWKPHQSQQKPLRPGSAMKQLKDVL